MQSISIQDLFGANASQNSTELIIKKADLIGVGLTIASENRTEQLLIAILIKALSLYQGVFVDEFGNIFSDEFNQSIGYDNREIYEFLELFRWDAYIKERENAVYLTETIVINSYAKAD